MSLHAQIPRLSGQLEESWRREGLMTEDSTGLPARADFTQSLDLRLDGAVLTPNFITWRLGSGLREQRLDTGPARLRLRRFNTYDLRLDILKARPLSWELYSRHDLLLQDSRASDTRRSDLTLQAGLRLIRPGWPLTRAGWQLTQSRQKSRLDYRNLTGTLELRNNGPNSQVDFSFRDEHRRQLDRGRVQELALRASTRLWEQSTAVTGEVRARQEARSRELHNSVRFNGRWREKDRLNLALSSSALYLQDGSRHNMRAQGDYRRQLTRRWNTLARGDLSRLLVGGAGSFHSGRQDLGAGVEYEQLERDSLRQRWDRANLLGEVQGASGRSLGAGIASQALTDRQRQLTPALRLGWGGSTGLVFRRLEARRPYAWTSALRGDAQWQGGPRLLLAQRLEAANQTGSGLRQSLGAQTEFSCSPLAPLWLQSSLRATRELRPLRRNTVDWNSSLVWPLGPRLRWTTEATLSYLGNARPLGRRAQSTLELTQRRLRFLLEGRYERLSGRRDLGAFVSLTRTIGG
jgi:hypothetical protein